MDSGADSRLPCPWASELSVPTKLSWTRRRLDLGNQAARGAARHGDGRLRGQPDAGQQCEHVRGCGMPDPKSLKLQPAAWQGGSRMDTRRALDQQRSRTVERQAAVGS